jgi:hypothetical protein
MQHGNPTSDKRTQWHPFSWRRMNSRQAWILLGVAAAFIVIGLILV